MAATQPLDLDTPTGLDDAAPATGRPAGAAVRRAHREAKATRASAVNLLVSVFAGLAAGTVFLALEYAASLVAGAGTPFGPAGPTLDAFMGLASNAPTSPVTLLISHFGLALLSILPLALVVRHVSLRMATLVGALYGGLLFGLYSVFTTILMPGLVETDLALVVNYALFGATGAYLTKRLGY